jgi:integrase/recombinase XerD
MAARGYSPRTIGNRRAMLAFLAAWLSDRGITRPAEVTRPVLESYQRHLRHLFRYRKKNGDPLSFPSQSQLSAYSLPCRARYGLACRGWMVSCGWCRRVARRRRGRAGR